MGRFADWARTRACLRWRGTGTASPRPWETSPFESRRRKKNFLKPGQTQRPNRPFEKLSTLDRLLGRALNFPAMPRRKKNALWQEESKQRTDREKKRNSEDSGFFAWRGITGSANAILNSGRVESPMPTARSKCWGRRNLDREQIPCCQIAAGGAGYLPYERVAIRAAGRDTTVVPNSGPTVASRNGEIVGNCSVPRPKGIQQTLTKDGLLKKTAH